MQNQRLIVVIGMHRSGTSLISRSIRAFGAEHGTKLIAGKDNIKGHWEDSDLMQLNDELLNYTGRAWPSMSRINYSEILILLSSPLREKAKSLLKSKARGLHLFCFKDPRTTILLDFWHEVFKELGLIPTIIFCIRNPTAVAYSLQVRNNFDHLLSINTWINYNLEALEYLTLHRSMHSIVDYDQLLADPTGQVVRISRDIRLKIVEHELYLFKDNFVDKRLNHADPEFRVTENACKALKHANQLYTYLLSLTHEPQRLKNHTSSYLIKSWQQQQKDIEPLLRLCDSEIKQRRESDAKAFATQDEMRHIKQSISWKLTKPLRAIRHFLN